MSFLCKDDMSLISKKILVSLIKAASLISGHYIADIYKKQRVNLLAYSDVERVQCEDEAKRNIKIQGHPLD